MAQTFTPADWDFLLETAVLHAAFWDGDRTVASELRLRVAKFGATPEDRLRLKLEIEADDQGDTVAESSDVPDIADYRRKFAAGSE
ncbi:hypothetical protein [Kitasatospora aureofaciens]|uniref:phage terminase small subunit n=1 Tax=Kitasatospora aureofaciens TaxID=1894 RepID=UPI0033CE5F8B